jgi:hypothetical protein
MTVCAGLFTVLALGVRGHSFGWATVLSIAMGALLLAMLVFAAFFAGIWFLAQVFPTLRAGETSGPAASSPFAPSRPEAPASPPTGNDRP